MLKTDANEAKIFASFKGTETNKTEKPKEQKALITCIHKIQINKIV